MKKLIILAMILALMGIATIALAGPGGPWYLSDSDGDPVPEEEGIPIPAPCPHQSGFWGWGVWYTNVITGATRCFLK